MNYEVYLLPKAKKKVDKFPDSERIEKKLKTLESFPNITSVIRIEKDIYRMRIGDYRALFKVYEEEKAIVILDVDVRGKIYKNL